MIHVFRQHGGSLVHVLESDKYLPDLVDAFFAEAEYAAEVRLGWKYHQERLAILAKRYPALYGASPLKAETPEGKWEWVITEWLDDFARWLVRAGWATSPAVTIHDLAERS